MHTPLAEIIELPNPPVVLYEHPPLVLALCQLRFPRVLSFADPAVVAPFQAAVAEQYPVIKEVRELPLTPPGIQLPATDPASVARWQFGDSEDSWTVVLAQDFVALETRAYERFSEFLEQLRFVLHALVALGRVGVWSRLGLRYINEIRLDPLAVPQTIRKELLGPLAEPALVGKAETAQSMQQLALAYEGGQNIRITHGLSQEGTTVRPRGEEPVPEGPFYLLDFDTFTQRGPDEATPLDLDQICSQVETLNRVIYRLFRWSTTEAYQASLGVRDAN